MPIEELDLSASPYLMVKREGIKTIGDLASKTRATLQGYLGFNQASIYEVEEKLATLNLELAE